MPRILRTFTFWIRADKQAECDVHVQEVVLPMLRGFDGVVRAVAFYRVREDGLVEGVVASTWKSMAHVEAALGDRANKPVGVYPGDFFVDREPRVRYAVLQDDESLDAQALSPSLDP